MNASSEMQNAEGEIRAALEGDMGPAMSALFAAYTRKSPSEKDAFVAVLIGHVVSSEGLRRSQAGR